MNAAVEKCACSLISFPIIRDLVSFLGGGGGGLAALNIFFLYLRSSNFIGTCLCVHHSLSFSLEQGFAFQSESEIFFHFRIGLEFIFKYLSCYITLVLFFRSPMLLTRLGVLDLHNHLPPHWKSGKIEKVHPACFLLMLMSALLYVSSISVISS